jgi:hypothetical protein
MTRRTRAEWLALFEAYAQSGLTAEAFCKEHQINPKYFSLRKQQLLKADSPFVEAVVQSPANGEIILRHGKTTLSLSRDVSPVWVAQLIHAL